MEKGERSRSLLFVAYLHVLHELCKHNVIHGCNTVDQIRKKEEREKIKYAELKGFFNNAVNNSR